MYTIISLLGIIGYNINYIFLLITSVFFDIYIFKSKDNLTYSKKLLEFIEQNYYYKESNYIYENKEHLNGLCFSKNKKFACYISYDTVSSNHQVKTDFSIYYIGELPFKIEEPKQEIEIDIKTNKKKSINIYVRRNQWLDSSSFNLVEIPFNYEPYENQKKIIDKIICNYKSNQTNIGRYLISGKTGIGKSFIGKLLAQKLNSNLTFDIKLDIPGSDINTMYLNAESITKETPLIVLLDEWDIMIRNIHEAKYKKRHDWLLTSIYNKESYNNFLSERVLLFPHVIYIFTMNSSIESINVLDKCYLRDGRMDLRFNL